MRIKKELIWSIALAMIFLVVTIPFYVSSVFAQDISKIDHIVSPTPTGSNNASGFIMSSDTLTIIVNLRATGIPETDVAKYVFADFGKKEEFTSCNSLGSSWYNCVYQKQLSGMPGGTYSGQIILDAPSCTSCNVPVSFNVDALPPEFSEFSITPQKTNSQNVTISYKADDKACIGCNDICSGIKNVIIYPSNDYSKIIANISVNQQPNSASSCADFRTSNISISALGSGNYSICIAATDNAGNSNITPNKCTNLVIAREPPTVGTPMITDSSGNIFTYAPLKGVLATISANITSPFADITNAIVDLSSFQLSNQTMSCLNVNGTRIWSCKAQFYAMIPAGSTTQTVPIYVYDDAGNSARADFVFGLQQDNKAPELYTFKTNYMFKNFSFFGPYDNKITVELAESQSGFHKNMTYVSGLGNYFDVLALGPLTLYEAQCSPIGGNIWQCSWPSLDLKSNEKKATLAFTAYDDVSNKLEFSRDIPIDTEPPQVIDIEMHTEKTYPAIGVGDNIVLRANITDSSAIVDSSGNYNVYADLTQVEGGEEMRRADSCELKNETYREGVIYEGSQWVCSWIIRDIEETYSWIPSITVSDIEGNNNTYNDFPKKYIAYVNEKTGNISLEQVNSFDVLPRETNVSNHWKVKAGEPTPSSLDRQMLQVISPYVYVPLKFIPLHGEPKILEVKLKHCNNDGTASEINIFPNVPDARDIEVKIVRGNYGTGEYEEREFFRYPCKIGIVSIADGKITQEEIDEVTIRIGLYNMPLGRFDENVKEKVDWIHEQEQSLLTQTIALIKQVLDWMKFLCSAYHIIVQIVAIIQVIMYRNEVGLDVCTATVILAPICVPVLHVVKESSDAQQVAIGGLSKVMEPICQFANCDPGANPTSLVGKWQQFYYKIRDMGSARLAEAFAEKETGVLHDIVEGGASYFIQFWPANLQDSLILSMVFVCLPGVVYNLEKYRQIQCNYGYCILTMAAQGGPLKGCEETYKLQTCTAVVGEIFNVIPYGATFANINAFWKTVLHDPISFVFFTVGMGCTLIPEASASEICKITNTITNAIGFVANMISFGQQVIAKIKEGENAFTTTDICKQFEKAYDDMKV